jgi:transcriptional regulator with XRE-family HTH domain
VSEPELAFGQLLRQLREQASLTQAALSAASGIAEKSIQTTETSASKVPRPDWSAPRFPDR